LRLTQTDFQCRPRLWKFLALSVCIHRKYRTAIWRVSNFSVEIAPFQILALAVALSKHGMSRNVGKTSFGAQL
jgi:hypothetical protein